MIAAVDPDACAGEAGDLKATDGDVRAIGELHGKLGGSIDGRIRIGVLLAAGEDRQIQSGSVRRAAVEGAVVVGGAVPAALVGAAFDGDGCVGSAMEIVQVHTAPIVDALVDENGIAGANDLQSFLEGSEGFIPAAVGSAVFVIPAPAQAVGDHVEGPQSEGGVDGTNVGGGSKARAVEVIGRCVCIRTAFAGGGAALLGREVAVFRITEHGVGRDAYRVVSAVLHGGKIPVFHRSVFGVGGEDGADDLVGIGVIDVVFRVEAVGFVHPDEGLVGTGGTGVDVVVEVKVDVPAVLLGYVNAVTLDVIEGVVDHMEGRITLRHDAGGAVNDLGSGEGQSGLPGGMDGDVHAGDLRAGEV